MRQESAGPGNHSGHQKVPAQELQQHISEAEGFERRDPAPDPQQQDSRGFGVDSPMSCACTRPPATPLGVRETAHLPHIVDADYACSPADLARARGLWTTQHPSISSIDVAHPGLGRARGREWQEEQVLQIEMGASSPHRERETGATTMRQARSSRTLAHRAQTGEPDLAKADPGARLLQGPERSESL